MHFHAFDREVNTVLRLGNCNGKLTFRFVYRVVVFGGKLVVHLVLACVGRDRQFRRILAAVKFVSHRCACRTACIDKRLRLAAVRQTGFCSGCRYLRRRFGNHESRCLLRGIVVVGCGYACLDNVSACFCGNNVDKVTVGGRAVSKTRRAELSRSNGRFCRFAVRPTLKRKGRDFVCRFCHNNGQRLLFDTVVIGFVDGNNLVRNGIRACVCCSRKLLRPLAVVKFVQQCSVCRNAVDNKIQRLAVVNKVLRRNGCGSQRCVCLGNGYDNSVFRNEVGMVVVAEHFVVNRVLACVCRRGYVGRPGTVRAEFVLHRAAVGYTCRDKFLRTACVDKVCNCRRHVGKSCV